MANNTYKKTVPPLLLLLNNKNSLKKPILVVTAMLSLNYTNPALFAITDSHEPLSETNPALTICHPVTPDDFKFYSHSLQRLFNDVHFTPLINENQISAYKISFIKPGSPIQAYGLEKGDIIKTINNSPISAGHALLETLSNIKQSPVLELQVEKSHQQTINYQYWFAQDNTCSDQ